MGEQKKIIFVNSFKGGTGKTTLSLAHCIDDLFHVHAYENVIYLDLDILGTATSYLFEEGKLPEEKSFDKTGETQEIELKSKSTGEIGTLHTGYLSAEMKKSSNYGEPYFLHHQKVLEEIFIKRITDFIDDRVKENVSSLIVVDCAPGFGEIEQRVLADCYKKKRAEIEEEYLVTLDSAHVKKCIQALIEHDAAAEITKRNICMVVNDVQNYCGYLIGEGSDDMEVMDEIMQQIYDKVSVKSSKWNMTFRFWKYAQEIAAKSVYTKSTYLENHVDDYRFTGENYREWKVKRGKGNWI